MFPRNIILLAAFFTSIIPVSIGAYIELGGRSVADRQVLCALCLSCSKYNLVI